MDSLGVYISVPFCRSKCSYCNFASGVHPESRHAAYIDRVVADMRRFVAGWPGLDAVVPRRVDSIYLGGGTPSILAPELLLRLIGEVRAGFEVTADAEITLECAPGQIEEACLDAMLECGVNRVSFGVQSFVDREAAVTGRLHTCEVALRDIERVRAAGVRGVNADLIAGLPHQDGMSWRESLETLAGSGVDHASVYMLEVDEDSRLGREMLAGGGRYHAASVPDDDRIADFYIEAVEYLEAQGLAQYEISNFARGTGARSLHNLKYWKRQPYVGLGLDAHSMLRDADGGALRFQSGDVLELFLKGGEALETEKLTRAAELEEAWFLGLRLHEGLELGALREEFGAEAVDAFEGVLKQLCAEGLLLRDEHRVRLSRRGVLVSNDVFTRFLGDGVSVGGAAVERTGGSPPMQKELVTVTY